MTAFSPRWVACDLLRAGEGAPVRIWTFCSFESWTICFSFLFILRSVNNPCHMKTSLFQITFWPHGCGIRTCSIPSVSVRLMVGQLRQPHQCRCQLNNKTFKVKSNISFEPWHLWCLQTSWLFLLLNRISAKLSLWKCYSFKLFSPTLLCCYFLFSDFCTPALVALYLRCWLTIEQCTEGPAAVWPGNSWENSSFKT